MLNRCTVKSCTQGSNPCLSATYRTVRGSARLQTSSCLLVIQGQFRGLDSLGTELFVEVFSETELLRRACAETSAFRRHDDDDDDHCADQHPENRTRVFDLRDLGVGDRPLPARLTEPNSETLAADAPDVPF